MEGRREGGKKELKLVVELEVYSFFLGGGSCDTCLVWCMALFWSWDWGRFGWSICIFSFFLFFFCSIILLLGVAVG